MEEYIVSGNKPILLEENLKLDKLKYSVILDANCDRKKLRCENKRFKVVPPSWFTEITLNSRNKRSLLIVNNLNCVSKKEQRKFYELLKYKKIEFLNLPENCTILITCKNLKENQLDKKIDSLLIHV